MTLRGKTDESSISGGDRELLDWLVEYVFPTESNFKDNEYAKQAYNNVISRSIASGVGDYLRSVSIGPHGR